MVDNGEDFSLHLKASGALIRSFKTPLSKHYPRQVVFGELGSVVVGGSDHGKVYVFDANTGASLDVLHHSSSGLVGTVAVSQAPSFI